MKSKQNDRISQTIHDSFLTSKDVIVDVGSKTAYSVDNEYIQIDKSTSIHESDISEKSGNVNNKPLETQQKVVLNK